MISFYVEIQKEKDGQCWLYITINDDLTKMIALRIEQHEYDELLKRGVPQI